MSPDAVALLVRAALPDASDELCAACFETSAGNPFYLRQLLVSLDGEVSADDARGAGVPDLGDRIARRVAAIGPEAAPLARAMAVIGDGGRLATATAVAGVDARVAAAAATQMTRVEILTRDDPFEFAHPLVRHSLYEGLSDDERDAAHLAAARVLRDEGAAPGIVATHLAARRPSGSDEVVEGLRLAARDALGRGAPGAAAVALRRALEEGAPGAPRAVLLSELGEIEVVGRDLSAIEHLTEALKLADDPVLHARIALALGAIYGAMGQFDVLQDVLSGAIDALDGSEPELALEIESYRAIALANDSVLVGEYDSDVDRLLELAQGESWSARALCALIASIWVTRGERLDEVRPLIEHGLRDDYRLLRERGSGAWPGPQVLMALVLIGETERALEINAVVESGARRDGSLIGALIARGAAGWAHARSGALVEAEGEIQTVMDVAMPNDMQMEVASFYWFLCDVIGERAGIDAIAAATLELEPGEGFERTMAGAMMLEIRARTRLARGDRDGAIADLRAAAPVNTRLGVGPVRGNWRSTLALALGDDERSEALRLVDEEVALATAAGLPRPLGVALRAAGVLRDDVALLERSVELLGATDARLEHARSLLSLGEAQRRAGAASAARVSLAAALELAHRCGADGTAGRAAEELRAAGARPRRRVQTGVDALTAAEVRVARLVAVGNSNADTAQELFLSLKTVESHLSRVYAKLDLSGPGARRRLGEVMSAEAA